MSASFIPAVVDIEFEQWNLTLLSSFVVGAMGLNVPATMPFAVFGALEAVRSSKISKFSASHRPISTWKSFVNSDPGSSLSSVAVPLQSSV